MVNHLSSNKAYQSWFSEIKEKISSAQVRSALAANRELICFYYEMGASIILKQREMAWGNKVIDQLSADLKSEFPGISGFSRTNLYYMKIFYEFFSCFDDAINSVCFGAVAVPKQIVPQAGGQLQMPDIVQLAANLPWGHLKVLLDKVKEPSVALFYLQETILNGWSRDVLALQIKSELHQRKGQAITNFEQTLPAPQSDLAQQTIKDPYSFDFLTLTIVPQPGGQFEERLFG